MAIELVVPEVGESIQEVQVGRWLLAKGEHAAKEQGVVEIETDKISFEIAAPVSGVITRVVKAEGETAAVGEVVGYMEEGEAPAAEAGAEAPAPAVEARKEAPADASSAAGEPRVMPAARRVLAEAGVRADEVTGTGPGGRITKEDAVRARTKPPPAPPTPAPAADPSLREEVVPMTPLRRRIAERLVSAQQNAALLTTFNEIDMTAVIAARREYQDQFKARHDVKLGFMSFFVKAAVDALKLVPQVNAEVRGDEIVYKNHYDIGVAVGGGKGLVVPVIRDADRLGFAEIEITIADLARRAQDGSLTLAELSGGTFTISNGGIYGSLLSTPIVNPPQSGILGLHAINERPVGLNGEIVLRPMMYVAVTYDHRIVDGREAVTFLARIKDCVEDPKRMLLEI
jgi:2-oxoglutarate dehydrogenase E2 component (dihydrolipoamide succinyltransferase)